MTARSRMRTLWAADPVKYCRAAPHTSGRTVRRSTWRPSLVRIDALVSPKTATSATWGSSVKARATAGRVGGGGEEVDVVDGGLHAPQRPGDLDPL